MSVEPGSSSNTLSTVRRVALRMRDLIPGSAFDGTGAFYEDWRQEALTQALGQVQCPFHTRGCLEYGLDCVACGAQV